MRIMAWNYQGIRQSLTVQELKSQIRSKNPDIIFPSETKCQSINFRRKIKLQNIWNSYCISSIGFSKGLVLV